MGNAEGFGGPVMMVGEMSIACTLTCQYPHIALGKGAYTSLPSGLCARMGPWSQCWQLEAGDSHYLWRKHCHGVGRIGDRFHERCPIGMWSIHWQVICVRQIFLEGVAFVRPVSPGVCPWAPRPGLETGCQSDRAHSPNCLLVHLPVIFDFRIALAFIDY